MAKPNNVQTGLRAVGVGSTTKVDTSRGAYQRESMEKMEQGMAQEENYKDFVVRKTQSPKK